MAVEGDVALDPTVIKALSADTRRQVLKLLTERRKTLTELARALGLRKATVYEHLQLLADAGLIKRRDEENRLWVYYELTHRGRQIINPTPAPTASAITPRFFLALATVVVVGLVGLTIFLAFQSLNPSAPPTNAPDQESQLNLVVDEAQAAGGSPFAAQVRVYDKDGNLVDPASAHAYLLTPQQAEGLTPGEEPTEGIPLQAFQVPYAPRSDFDSEGGLVFDSNTTAPTPSYLNSEDSVGSGNVSNLAAPPLQRLELQSPDSLPSGDYVLYVRTDVGGEHRGGLVPLRIPHWQVTVTPSTWWRGLDGPVDIRVARDGAAVNGTLLVEPASAAVGSTAGLSVALGSGRAGIDPATLDALAPQAYRLVVLGEGENDRVRLPADFEIREPRVALFPLAVTEARPSDLFVSLAADGRPPESVPVLLNGTALSLQHYSTNVASHRWAAATPGAYPAVAGRLAVRELVVHPDLRLTLLQRDGQDYLLTAQTVGGAGVRDALVLVDGQSQGVTDENGDLPLARPSPGLHVLRVVMADGHSLDRPLQVVGWNAFEPSILLDATANVTSPAAGRIEALVNVTNPGPAAVPATLLTFLDDSVVDARAIDVPGGRTVNVSVGLAGVDAGQHRIGFRAEPLAWSHVLFVNGTASSGSGAPAASSTAAATSTTATSAATESTAALPYHPGSVLDVAVNGTQVLRAALPSSTLSGTTGPGEARMTKSPGIAAPAIVVGLVAAAAILAWRRR